MLDMFEKLKVLILSKGLGYRVRILYFYVLGDGNGVEKQLGFKNILQNKISNINIIYFFRPHFNFRQNINYVAKI